MEDKKQKETLEKKRSFIERSREMHKNSDNTPKYDYSKVEYKSNIEKVIIVCPIHGDFETTPKNHLQRKNCPQCGKKAMIEKLKDTKEEFISKAIMKHHDEEGNPLFDYSLVEYVNSNSKVKIICKKEGHIFEQEATLHIQGNSCNICFKNKITNKKKNKELFIKKCQETRVDENNEPLYDYDLVEYVNSYTKVKVKCKNNHIFEQTPDGQINGKNCLECISQYNITNNEQYIKESNKVHNNKYDYSKTNFTRMNELVTITCNNHGDFMRTAFTHLIYQRGCPNC